MNRAFRITPRVAQDLRNTARYTLQTWGRKQRDIYLKAIDQRFSWLAENPNLGKPRPEIKEGYFSYPQGSHVIFYLVREGRVDIIGVLQWYPAYPVASELRGRRRRGAS